MKKFPMIKALSLLIAAVLFLFFAGTLRAQYPSNPWNALYWNNSSMQGEPALQRQEASVPMTRRCPSISSISS